MSACCEPYERGVTTDQFAEDVYQRLIGAYRDSFAETEALI
jgi:hypothetical protein